MKNLTLGILGSGKGSNCRAILEQIRDDNLDAEARLVVSDVFDAGILDIAREFGVPNVYLPPGSFRTRLEPAVEMELVRLLRQAGVELVVLAGFMRVLTPNPMPYSMGINMRALRESPMLAGRSIPSRPCCLQPDKAMNPQTMEISSDTNIPLPTREISAVE